MSEGAVPPRRWRRLGLGLAPAHGWADFITELAIVVLGVLIALGAQQVADTLKTRSDIADLRAALDAELADGLNVYHLRITQERCLERRLAQLETWQRDWNAGTGTALDGQIGRPFAGPADSSVWASSAIGTVGRMPLADRLAYSELYGLFGMYNALSLREVNTWYELFDYDGARQLSPDAINRLRGLILAARSTNNSLSHNYPQLVEEAARLGIRPPPIAADSVAENSAASGLCGALRAGGKPLA